MAKALRLGAFIADRVTFSRAAGDYALRDGQRKLGTRSAPWRRMTLARFKGPLAVIAVEDTVEKAACLMRDRHVGSLVVTRHGRPAGILTDRDLVVRVVAGGRDPSTATIGEFLTNDPITVSVEDGIETAVERMRRHGVRRLPIVDEDGVAVGIVTTDDLLVLLGREIAAVCEGIENCADAEDSR